MSVNLDLNPGDRISFEKDPYFPEFKAECIITDKVYFSCQQRECFEKIVKPITCLEGHDLVDIVFNPGEIVPNTLSITPIPNRPNFSRVRFKLTISYTIRLRSKTDHHKIMTIDNVLPEIEKDIIMFIPEARDEFTFQIVLETASQLLTEPIRENGALVFAVGVFVIVKVVGRVQLLIPAFGFCPEPPDCEEFLPEEVCFDFDEAPFPDFFPPQMEDIENNII